jgi:hypothetical protein
VRSTRSSGIGNDAKSNLEITVCDGIAGGISSNGYVLSRNGDIEAAVDAAGTGDEDIGNIKTGRKSDGDNFEVGFFDELQLDPISVLRGAQDFLGVDSGAGMIPEGVKQKVNKGTVETVPARFRPLLWDLYGEQIAGLHEKYRNSYTEKWLKAGPEGV